MREGGEKPDDLLATGETPALPMDPHAQTERPPASGGASSAAPSGSGAIPSGPLSSSDWLAADASLERTTERSLTVPNEATRDRATLTVLSGFNAGQVFALDHDLAILGRGTDADVWAEDPAVSRRHAKISRTGDGRYFLEDLGSTNGTFLGARRVDKCELMSGDRVQLGPNLLMRFALVDDREEELQRRLYESSTRDALTRAYNKKYLGERLVAEVAHARRHGTALSVVMLDLDDFKKLNDTAGHLAGDLVLRVVSAQIMRLLRVEDLLARWGGEEFAILARSTTNADARRLAERVRKSLAALAIPVKSGAELRTTASFGVASLDELAPEAAETELVHLADARLLRAKTTGKNRVIATG